MATTRTQAPRLLLTLAVFAVFAAAQTNQLTTQEEADGWRLLFDGKTLDGWQATGNTQWSVVDGAIVPSGEQTGYLESLESYSDLVLRVDFRCAADANSGVFVRSQPVGQGRGGRRGANAQGGQGQGGGGQGGGGRGRGRSPTFYEVQIWREQPAGYNTGGIVGVANAIRETNFRPDEWNTYEITADGDHIVVVLNGETTLDTHDSSLQSGRLRLQYMGFPIEFRNLKIKVLNQ